MKKKLLKVLSTLLISCNLFVVPASANTWHRITNGDIDNPNWYMTDDYGNVLKSQWYFDNYNWYYLSNNGVMLKNQYCSYNNIAGMYLDGNGTEINGKIYFFDENGHMLHDCYVSQGSGHFKCWINSDGSLDTEHTYGDKYNGYN